MKSTFLGERFHAVLFILDFFAQLPLIFISQIVKLILNKNQK